MATFDDLALNGGYPVIHSTRSDQATIIATRVPTNDLWSEQWGWILTLNQRDGRTAQNDIETLRDNTGRQFPKVYTLTDMRHYIERWSCIEWGEGYHQNDHQKASLNGAASASADLIREEMLRKLLSELQTHQDEQVAQLIDEFTKHLAEARGGIEKSNVECFTTFQNSTLDSYDALLKRTHVHDEEATKQLVGLDQAVAHTTSEMQEQSRLIREEAEQHVRVLTDEIKNTTALSQKATIDALDDLSLMVREETRRQLEEARGEIKTDLAAFTTELRALEEQIKLALQELDPDLEEDVDKTQNADPASAATKMVRKATTQIERITASHQRMSIKYFDSANEQSRKAFKYAWFLGFTAVGLFAAFIGAAIFMALLHLYGFAVVLGSVGAIGGSIVTVMGWVSSSHARTIEQFAYAQKLLDRRYGSTIANAMIIGYSDEDHKQSAIDKIIESLLKDEVTPIASK